MRKIWKYAKFIALTPIVWLIDKLIYLLMRK